jgi:hypothetical protein
MNQNEFEKKIHEAFRKVGREAPVASRDTGFVDQLAELKRRKAKRDNLIGRPPKPPRAVFVGTTIKIRHLGKDHSTGIKLSPSIDVGDALILAEAKHRIGADETKRGKRRIEE